MDVKIKKILGDKFVKKAEKDKDIVWVILFGSYIKKNKGFSEIDVCLMLRQVDCTPLFLSKKRQSYLKLVSDKIDIQIFQQLPSYVGVRILKEGKFLLNKNLDETFKVAIAAIKEFELFKPHYHYYLESVRNGRS